MKKWIAIILALVFVLGGGAAVVLLTQNETAYAAETVYSSNLLSAYADGTGSIYITGSDKPVNKNAGFEVVSIDPYRLIYLSEDEDGSGNLQQVNLITFEDKCIYEGVADACLADEDTLYFIDNEDSTVLKKMTLNGNSVVDAYTANEAIVRLYSGSEGLVMVLDEDTGAMVFDAESEEAVSLGEDIPVQSCMSGDTEVYLTADGDLYRRENADFAAQFIDSDVLAFTLYQNKLYYLWDDGETQKLKAYDPDAKAWTDVLTPDFQVEDQLASTSTGLYMMDEQWDIYAVDTESGRVSRFAGYADIPADVIPEGQHAADIRMEGMSGQLNVYVAVEEDNELPAFSFFEEDEVQPEQNQSWILLKTFPIGGEATAWSILNSTAGYNEPLMRGSRGNAVRAIQRPLYELGYYDYYVDGIFGPRTEKAVMLVQDDLGLTVNGIADEKLQQTILRGVLEPYDPWKELRKGARGLRVKQMQETLRELGYMQDDADGIFGSRTLKAVQLFQSENDLNVYNRATRSTLMLLYSEDASPCSRYIDLYKGDTGRRVRSLNRRLKELYYLKSDPGSTYTSATEAAVKRFQQVVGLTQTGEASEWLQQWIFSTDAPECPDNMVLRRGDENRRVRSLQERLKELGYFSGNVTGYYGRITEKAVMNFQRRAGLEPSGIATIETQRRLFERNAPRYEQPTILSEPAIRPTDWDDVEGKTYYISEKSAMDGIVSFRWNVEGEVDYYTVKITDSDGRSIINTDTHSERTSVALAHLIPDCRYTLHVTAYPKDGRKEHITKSQISFVRKTEPYIPPVGWVDTPEISIELVDHTEGGVAYIKPGKVIFDWHADGEVDHYRIEIMNENNKVIYSSDTKDLTRIEKTADYKTGKLYTLTVYAIPVNGTIEDAEINFAHFAIAENAKPTPAPTTEPTPEPTAGYVDVPALDITPAKEWKNGVIYVLPGTIELSWHSEGDVDSYFVEIVSENDDTVLSLTTSSEKYTLITDKSLDSNLGYELKVLAVPKGHSKADGAFASAKFALFTEPEPESKPEQEPEPEFVVEPESVLSIPEINMNPVTEKQDDLIYINAESVNLTWNAEGKVREYHVEIADSKGRKLASENTEDEGMLLTVAGNLQQDEVYTLQVSALPADNKAESTSNSVQFVVVADGEPESEEPIEDEPAPETENIPEPETESETAPEPETTTEQAADVSTESEPEAAAVGIPEIRFEPMIEEMDGVSYVENGIVSLSWYAEGEVSAYRIVITDSDGNTLADRETDKETLTLNTEKNLAEGGVYTLYVTAIPQDGTVEDGQTASRQFARYISEAEPELETEPDPEPEAEPEVEPEAEPEPEPETEAAEVGVPEIRFEPTLKELDGICCLEKGIVSLCWYAEGEVSAYHISIMDSDGNIVADRETEKETLTLDTEKNLAEGIVYTLCVTAIPQGGTAEDGQTASRRFTRYISEAEPEPEPDPEPENEQEPEPEPEPESEPEPEPETEAAEVGVPEIQFEPTLEEADGVSYVDNGSVTLSWCAEGEVSAYHISIADADGNVIAETETEREALTLDTEKNLAEGIVYTLYVEAIPQGGTAEDGQTASRKFARYINEAEPEPENEQEPEQEPEPEPEPESEPETEAAEVGVPEIQFEPTVEEADGVSYVENGSVTLSWYAEGEVSAYHVSIADDDGNIIAETETEKEALTLDTKKNLAEGIVYTIYVEAIPQGGTAEDGQSASRRFARYINEPEPEPEPEPEQKEEEPEYEEPEYEEPEYEEPEYEDPEYEEPEYEDPEYEEPEYVEPEYEEPAYEESEYAEPEYEQQTEGETEEEIILEDIQTALVEQGWLDPEQYTPGVLDAATIAAIQSYQEAFELPLMDAESEIIDDVTIESIMNNELLD